MHRKPLRLIAGLVVLSSLAAAGCGSSSGGGNPSSSCPLIGVTDRSISNNAWQATLVKSIQAAAKNAGVCVDTQDAQNDVATQNSQIRTFITEGAKAVVIDPVDNTGAAPAIAALKKAKIPYIVVVELIGPALAKQAYCNIHADEFKVSGLVGQAVAAAAAKRYHVGETIKLWVNAIFPHEILTETRENGFLKGWSDYWTAHPGGPKTVRIPDQYGKADPAVDLPIVRNVLTANPDLGVMFNETDLTYGAVKTALSDLNLIKGGKSKVLIGGFDGQTSVLQDMIQHPDFGMVATGVNQPPLQGAWVVQEAVAAMKGKPAIDCPGETPTRLVPAIAVTSATAKRFYDPNYHNGYDQVLVNQAEEQTRQLAKAN